MSDKRLELDHESDERFELDHDPCALKLSASATDVARKLGQLSEETYWKFSGAGVGSHCHAFIEFCGLMSKYTEICYRSAISGIDFRRANVHTGVALPVFAHDVEYLAEKFECIFGPILRSRPEFAKLFVERALGVETVRGREER